MSLAGFLFCYVMYTYVCTYRYVSVHMGIFIYISTYPYLCIHTYLYINAYRYISVYRYAYYKQTQGEAYMSQAGMGWLRSVESIKLWVSFAEYLLFYRALLQKRPIM